MKSRVLGILKHKSHLYLGKELLEKNSFYNFSLNDSSFNSLFESWKILDYNRKFTPSIDRIESSLGYTLDNIRWLTHSQNSSFGGIKSQKLKKLKNG